MSAEQKDATRGRLSNAVGSLFQLLYPGEEAFSNTPAARREVRGLTAALIAAIVAVPSGLIIFPDQVALWAAVSPGSVGLVAAGIAAVLAAGIEYAVSSRSQTSRQERAIGRLERVIDLLAIALVHGGIALLVVGVAIAVLVRGFSGLLVDGFVSTVIVALLAAVTAYAATISAGDVTALRLSNLFAIFMTGGIVVAMLTTSDAEWWKLHFSELGAGDGVSGMIFNGTLIVGGLLLASLSSLIAPQLEAWAASAPPSRTRNVKIVGGAFAVIGACLAGVGIVPVDVNVLVHNSFATGMAVVFGVLLIGFRWLLDGFARAFMLFSDVSLIGIVVSAVLFWPVAYYNLAGFELVAAGIIFAWLVIFLRHLDVSSQTTPLTLNHGETSRPV